MKSLLNEIVLSLLAPCVFISVGGICASEKFGFVNNADFKELKLFYINNQYFWQPWLLKIITDIPESYFIEEYLKNIHY